MTNKEKLAFLALRKASLELQLTIMKQNIKSIEEDLEERRNQYEAQIASV